MSTCLDDINDTLVSINSNIANLSPSPPIFWSDAITLALLQPSTLTTTKQIHIGTSEDGETILVNAQFTATSGGTAGQELRISGLPPAAIDGGLIGTALMFSGTVYQVLSVWWFSDGLARLIGLGNNNNWGITPSQAFAIADVLRLNLSYRGA